MPVYERAVGILFPRPNVERVKGGETEAIGAFEIVEELSHQLRRSARMALIPGIGEDKVVGADQAEASAVHRFVDDDLRASRVDFSRRCQWRVLQKGLFRKMQAHSSRVRTSDASKQRLIAFSFGDRDVLKALRGIADNSQEFALRGRWRRRLLRRGWRNVQMTSLRKGAYGTKA